MSPSVKYAYLILIFLLFSPSPRIVAGPLHYSGNGISFSYPDSYRLQEKTEKTLKRVTVTKGTSSIGVNCIDTEMSDDLENRIIDSYRKKYKKMKLDDVRFQTKRKVGAGHSESFPFPHIKTAASRVDTSYKYMGIKLRTNLYLFSADGKGYIIEFTCRARDCPDYSFFKNSFSLGKKTRPETKRFTDHGIGFDYPDDFKVNVVKKKTIFRVVIQKKGSSLGIIELEKPLNSAMEEVMIREYSRKLEKSGFTGITISEKKPMGRNTAVAFPFKRIDTAVTFVTFTFRRKGIGYETLLYMFPYGKKGYTIDITRLSGIDDVFGFVYDSLELE